LRRDWGMDEIILAILCINTLFLIWQTRILGLAVQNSARELDSSIAAALNSIVENLGLGEIQLPDPPNPIMQVIAEAIGQSIKPPSLEVKEISRSDDGKFA